MDADQFTMAKLLALTSAIWLVIAVFATQPISSHPSSKKAKPVDLDSAMRSAEKLRADVAMSIEEIEAEIETIIAYKPPYKFADYVNVPIKDFRAELEYLNRVKAISGYEEYCNSEFFLNFEKKSKLTEQYRNVKLYSDYLRKSYLESCKNIALTEIGQFEEEKPEQKKKLEQIYSAIKSSDQLYAYLRTDGDEMNKATISALEDFLQVLDNHQRILSACQEVEFKRGFYRIIELVSHFSQKLEEHGRVTDYIRPYTLCAVARSDATLILEKLFSRVGKLDKFVTGYKW